MKKIFILLFVASCTNQKDAEYEKITQQLTESMDKIREQQSEDSAKRALEFKIEIERIKRKK